MLVAVIRTLAITTALSLMVLLFDGSLFSWHPTLMAAGSLGLMTEGVLTAVSFRVQEGAARVAGIWRHLVWQGSAAALLAGGFVAIYQNKVSFGGFQRTTKCLNIACKRSIWLLNMMPNTVRRAEEGWGCVQELACLCLANVAQ